ncbi:MAG: ArsA family ATPase [Candidatus Lokiarchaeota archaeon]|nr:ArsA family ATPase [Candidatus Lokiarchaeota archaeon]
MTLKDLLSNPDSHFILFGGKGGVGKTSSAACSALWAAENTDKSVLIVSTDPAHSLGDSLGLQLEPGTVTPVPGTAKLFALEISPSKAFKEAQEKMGGAGGLDMAMGGGMEGMNVPLLGDLGDLAGMSPPGADEAMAFGTVLEFLENSEYDLVIFDTAPTGHTLRLLSLPELLSSWIGKLITLRLKLGKLMGAFKNMFKRSKDKDDEADALESIERLKKSIEAAKGELQDPARTSFVIVMIAEDMAIYETERLLSALISYQIPSSHIVVNQIFPESLDCSFCKSRREFQLKHLVEIEDLYKDDFDVVKVPLFEKEIRKFDQLRRMARYVVEGEGGE